jgi:hypothetical protein
MKNLQFRTAASRECQRAVPDDDMQCYFNGANPFEHPNFVEPQNRLSTRTELDGDPRIWYSLL